MLKCVGLQILRDKTKLVLTELFIWQLKHLPFLKCLFLQVEYTTCYLLISLIPSTFLRREFCIIEYATPGWAQSNDLNFGVGRKKNQWNSVGRDNVKETL